MKKYSVLIIDDDPVASRLLSKYITQMDFETKEMVVSNMHSFIICARTKTKIFCQDQGRSKF